MDAITISVLDISIMAEFMVPVMEATSAGIMAGMLGGFVVTVVWKLVGEPMGLGATVPGAIACGVLLVGVSLATYRKRPTVMVEVK